jgi:DNA-binding IclR family transcriptional regulator
LLILKKFKVPGMAKQSAKTTDDTRYHAPALEKGLDILEFISLEAKPLSQSEIALGIDKNPNEIYRMLICLEQRGYLLRDEISGKYRPSLKMYNLSHRHSPIDEIRRVSRYPMDELSESIRQSCHISVLYRDKLIVISQSRSPGPIALSIEEGSLFPLIKTASGRVLLAFMEETERMTILQKNEDFKAYSARKQQKFLTSLKEIVETGHYQTPSDLATGVVDITVPVGNGKQALASLTVSILSMQLNGTITHEEILSAAKQAASRISANLGMHFTT